MKNRNLRLSGNQYSYVVSFDLSKNSTGLAVFEIIKKISVLEKSEWEINLLRYDTIKPNSAHNHTLIYHPISEYQGRKIEKILDWLSDNSRSENWCIVAEAIAHAGYSDDILYPIHQKLESIADRRGIDVIKFKPATLKSFIGRTVYDKRVTGNKLNDKSSINRVYRDYLYEDNKWLPVPDSLNSDELDALFLGLLGAITVVPYIDRISFGSESLKSLNTFEEFRKTEMVKKLLLGHPDFYSDLFKKGELTIRNFVNLKFSPKKDIPEQFKEVIGALVKNKHLSMKKPYLLPLNKLKLVGEVINFFWDTFQEKDIEFLRENIKDFPKILKENCKLIKVYRNRKGEMFFDCNLLKSLSN